MPPYQPICGHFTASADKNLARASHRGSLLKAGHKNRPHNVLVDDLPAILHTAFNVQIACKCQTDHPSLTISRHGDRWSMRPSESARPPRKIASGSDSQDRMDQQDLLSIARAH